MSALRKYTGLAKSKLPTSKNSAVHFAVTSQQLLNEDKAVNSCAGAQI